MLLAGALCLLTIAPARSQQKIVVSPGVNVQALVDASPAGSTFSFQPGTYRLTSIKPRNGDTFLGAGGALLSGAALLTNFSRIGGLYAATGQTQQGQVAGECGSAHPRCVFPEDLYFDSVPLFHAPSLSAVKPGSWYFDYASDTIYFADNPAGHIVETSVTRSAFHGSATDVTIDGFIIEKYAVPSQFGAIGDQYPGLNWSICNNEVRLNHGTGINLATNSKAKFNFVHHNGNKGIGGVGANIVVQGNLVSFNNFAGFNYEWEAGGMKFSGTTNLVVRGNAIYNNIGPGAWNDEYSVNTLYEGNVIMNNTGGGGIQYEISSGAIIRNNTICYNTRPNPIWLWGSQILIQNSQNVEVYQNTVETLATGGNGIGIIQQNRGMAPWGPALAKNNWIHHNSVTYRGGVSASGMVADWNQTDLLTNGNNLFDYNSYHLVDPHWYHWAWVDGRTFTGMQQVRQELHGTADNVMPPAQ